MKMKSKYGLYLLHIALVVEIASCFLPRKRQTFRRGSEAASVTEFLVDVQFEDTKAETVAVKPGESLLSALERAASARGWSEIPSDCRRGNCLTCTARHAATSRREHVQPLGDNGLSPAISLPCTEDKENRETYFLTCRSTVTGPGVSLHLGENTAAWTHVYQSRLTNEETRRAADVALARVLRKAAERDPVAWRQQTEALWERQQDGDENEENLS